MVGPGGLFAQIAQYANSCSLFGVIELDNHLVGDLEVALCLVCEGHQLDPMMNISRLTA
jgi:hypothetical protein